MFTFLPALILLLLHGPSTFEGPIGQSGVQTDIGALAPRMPSMAVRPDRAWIAELLGRIQGDALLVALGINQATEPTTEQFIAPDPVRIPSFGSPSLRETVARTQRDRDGPRGI